MFQGYPILLLLEIRHQQLELNVKTCPTVHHLSLKPHLLLMAPIRQMPTARTRSLPVHKVLTRVRRTSKLRMEVLPISRAHILILLNKFRVHRSRVVTIRRQLPRTPPDPSSNRRLPTKAITTPLIKV